MPRRDLVLLAYDIVDDASRARALDAAHGAASRVGRRPASRQ